jgi:hypothetical protein
MAFSQAAQVARANSTSVYGASSCHAAGVSIVVPAG